MYYEKKVTVFNFRDISIFSCTTNVSSTTEMKLTSTKINNRAVSKTKHGDISTSL